MSSMRCVVLVPLALCVGCQFAPTYPLAAVDREVDGTPIPEEAFCALFARTWCEGVDACRCVADRDECVFSTFDSCAGVDGFFGPEVREAIVDGRIEYSDIAAAALIDKLVGLSATCDPLESLEWTMADIVTFDGVMTGRLDPGRSCRIPWDELSANECKGSVCGQLESEPLHCVPIAGLGAPCGDNIVCVDFASRVIVDADLDGRSARCFEGTCVPAGEAGATCAFNRDCVSTRCERGVCLAVVEAGGACETDMACRSRHCDDSKCGGRNLSASSSCAFDGDCAEGACVHGVCAPAICSGYGPPLSP